MTTHKTIALTKWTFVGKVISLLFNMLSRLVIAFLPRSKHLLISWLQSPSAVILEPLKVKSECFHYFPIYLPWNDGTRCHDLTFLNVGEDSWEFLGLQGDSTSQSWRKLVLNIHWKNWCWSWNSNTLAILPKELTHWKRSWCWERLKMGRGSSSTEDATIVRHHQCDVHEFE